MLKGAYRKNEILGSKKKFQVLWLLGIFISVLTPISIPIANGRPVETPVSLPDSTKVEVLSPDEVRYTPACDGCTRVEIIDRIISEVSVNPDVRTLRLPSLIQKLTKDLGLASVDQEEQIQIYLGILMRTSQSGLRNDEASSIAIQQLRKMNYDPIPFMRLQEQMALNPEDVVNGNRALSQMPSAAAKAFILHAQNESLRQLFESRIYGPEVDRFILNTLLSPDDLLLAFKNTPLVDPRDVDVAMAILKRLTAMDTSGMSSEVHCVVLEFLANLTSDASKVQDNRRVFESGSAEITKILGRAAQQGASARCLSDESKTIEMQVKEISRSLSPFMLKSSEKPSSLSSSAKGSCDQQAALGLLKETLINYKGGIVTNYANDKGQCPITVMITPKSKSGLKKGSPIADKKGPFVSVRAWMQPPNLPQGWCYSEKDYEVNDLWDIYLNQTRLEDSDVCYNRKKK